SFPGKSEDTLLAYGQSYSIVKWLIETNGPEKLRSLMESLKAGDGLAKGLQQHYGVTVDQLDAKWRQSVGAPPRNYDSVAPTAIAIAPIAPIGAVPSAPQPAGSGSSGGSATPSGGVPAFLMVGAGVGVLLLLLVGGAAAFSIVRRR
ncbi:MAG: peptidase MA family metallohydrolase, partial [Chloroflexota bacterium]